MSISLHLEFTCFEHHACISRYILIEQTLSIGVIFLALHTMGDGMPSFDYQGNVQRYCCEISTGAFKSLMVERKLAASYYSTFTN